MPIAIATGRTSTRSGTAIVRPNDRADAATDQAREDLRQRNSIDPSLDDADRALEEAAEHTAAQVADETAEHPADARTARRCSGARSLPSMKPAAVSSTTVKSRVTSTNTEPPSQSLKDRRVAGSGLNQGVV